MTPCEIKEYLDSFVNYELSREKACAPLFNLERVRRLLGTIGNPQKEIKIIHVAGTKGKGSTCIFIAYILQAAGYRVGLYTSPHLNDYKERIRILDGSGGVQDDPFVGKIKEEDLLRIVEKLKPNFEAIRSDAVLGNLSFFEVFTAVALFYFRERQVDFAVMETGLGGRLDATNAVDSFLCGITPISLDHTELLGSTLKEIAAEKAAIIKNREQGIVVAPQEQEAMEMIKSRCSQVGTQPFFVGDDIGYTLVQNGFKEQTFNIKSLNGDYKNLKTRLLGRHQAINAATAVGLAELLRERGFKIGEEVIREGLKNALWPGRFEIIRENPFIVLDGAHNPGSCKVLAETMQKIFPGKKTILILGISADKDRKGISAELNRVADEIILTKAGHPRAFEFTIEESKGLFGKKDIIISKNVQEALTTALARADKGAVILITGSLFVVAEARRLCIDRT